MTNEIFSIYVADAPVRERLKRLQQKIGDLTPAFENIGQQLLLSTDQRFETETGVDGQPWKPNSARTIAIKKAQGRINKILQSTGRMRDSINYRASKDRLTIGTSVEYAAKNQQERPFLGISKDDEGEVIRILDEYLSE